MRIPKFGCGTEANRGITGYVCNPQVGHDVHVLGQYDGTVVRFA